MEKKRVFLGGTCNESTWRNRMMIYLYDEKVDYFNPVVSDWTEACQLEEIEQRKICDYCLYCITPKMSGVYSIAEVVDDSNKRPEKTILILLKDDGDCKFDQYQWKSLFSVARLVSENGAKVFTDLKEAAIYIGQDAREKDEIKRKNLAMANFSKNLTYLLEIGTNDEDFFEYYKQYNASRISELRELLISKQTA